MRERLPGFTQGHLFG